MDLGTSGEPVELLYGWWGREAYPEGVGGRWTGREAALRLERGDGYGGLGLAVTLGHPTGRTRGHINVNGKPLKTFEDANGRRTFILDIRGIPERSLTIRFVVENPFVPDVLPPPSERSSETDTGLPGAGGAGVFPASQRLHGMMVHAIWLQATPVASEVELASLEEGRPELGSGWWERERWADGQAGRWTQGDATLLLERRAEEKGLLLEVSSAHPSGETTGSIEVGQRAYRFRWANGEQTQRLDIAGIPGRQAPVRLIVDRPFEPGGPDRRRLGVFVRTVRLVAGADSSGRPTETADTSPGGPRAEARTQAGDGHLASALELGAIENGQPELAVGWWGAEGWPDGSRGRWTREDASLRLERRERETDLLVDVSFSHPSNLTTGFIEVNRRRLVGIRSANGRRRLVLDVRSIGGRTLVVRFVAERPFFGREQGSARGDRRRLGFFVHEVRLLGAERESRYATAP